MGEAMSDEQQNEFALSDAAKYLGVSPQRIHQLQQAGRLRGYLVASRWRVFSRAELDAVAAELALRPKGGRLPKTRLGVVSRALLG